jgi:hypothetical protein
LSKELPNETYAQLKGQRSEGKIENELVDILAQCYKDTKFMAQLLYPHEFYAPMTLLNDQFFDFIDNCDAPRKVITAPRGLMKTTGAKLLIKKRILFRDRHFIGYLTNSGTVAEFTSESIKGDLMANKMVKKIFGDVSTSKIEGVDDKWTQKSWIANGETLVLPRGAGQQVNGLLWLHYRPDFWVVDDLDDRIEVRSEVQRKRLREWFYGALMYTFTQYEGFQDYEMIYLDTIKHEDALINHLLEDPEWESLRISVCDDKYKTLAPDFKSQETLDREIKGHRAKRTMNIFAREMMSLSSSTEDGAFKGDYFQYYKETDPDFVGRIKPRLMNILIWDPSKTKNPTSAQTGLVVWGLDLEYNAFYVRLAVGEYLTVNEQQERVFELADTYQIVALGIETTSLEDWILYPFKNECIRQGRAGLASKIIPLSAKTGKGELTGEEGGKDGRIKGLLPLYEQGLIFHNENNCGPFEQQLLSFPYSKLKDIMDAAAYLNQMLEKGIKYMGPMSEEEDPIKIEQEYAVLQDNEPPIQRRIFR